MTVSNNCMQVAKFNQEFKDRVEYFMSKGAIAIKGEGTPTGDEHTKRDLYADKIMNGNASVEQYAIGVVTDDTISAIIDAGNEPTDAQLQEAVNARLSKFAGWDQ